MYIEVNIPIHDNISLTGM